jgi:hypothetical protein
MKPLLLESPISSLFPSPNSGGRRSLKEAMAMYSEAILRPEYTLSPRIGRKGPGERGHYRDQTVFCGIFAAKESTSTPSAVSLYAYSVIS